MSWPLASFAIVAIVLLLGWLAYERARPSARMVAVVATLAAVAALGRDAFVALPDVKPITALTLVVGYSLGPLPGFSVGAIGMLASNIVLGQGPYTPWQMAAWGLVGLLGALLGRVSARRLGRFGLAAACAFTALLAKEIMNVYTWTLGGVHTASALLAAAGSGLPFDLTDTIASFLFGLAFAPELARLLARLRARMDVRWEPAGALLPALLVIVAASALATPVHAAAPRYTSHRVVARAHAVARAHSAVMLTHRVVARVARTDLHAEVSFLERAQSPNGGFGASPGARSSELYSAWSAIGLAAAGRDPLSVRRDGHSVLDALRSEAATLEDVGDEERTILALYACGVPIGSVGGTNPLEKVLGARASDGSFDELVNITTFAIFALRASGRTANDPVVRAAARWLERQQGPDGGFGFAARGVSEDVDDTAAALQALVDAHAKHAVVLAAVRYLRRTQNPDGGYPQQPGDESNAQSTAWAVQGLIAAGQDPSTVKRDAGRSPLAYLQSLLAPNGSVRYSRTSSQTPVWVTAQALVALAGRPFPIAAVARRASVARALSRSLRASAGKRSPESAPSSTGTPRHPSNRGRAVAPVRRTTPFGGQSVAEIGDARLDPLARTAGVVLALVLATVLH